MSCYFRYLKDILSEAGVKVTPGNKRALDQAIHAAVGVSYKRCMPDCWSAVKAVLQRKSGRAALIAAIQRAH